MESIAVAVLAFFALGYLVLGGADLGVGVVLPFLARGDHERRLVVTAAAPFFLLNEVWLVASVGLLAGAFPDLEADLVHDHHAALTLVLVGWVLRDAGLWLRGRVDALGWRRLWDAVTVSGSWAAAGGWGALLAGVLTGAPGTSGAWPGGPTALVGMGAGVLGFALHGTAFAALRLTGAPRRRARLTPGRLPPGRLTPGRGEVLPFLVTGALVLSAGLAAGIRLAPGGRTADAASLDFLLPPLLIALPFLIGVQGWAWWVFRHRVTEPGYL
ncbi:cytochrome d ubiquinol oxidase subunit II (plasmid) [Streptomyces sp. BI20]|uniref:cytochrome d ubiquinol oxidase subunit II n=1 Tax=Streptomyces sp. BI20 TaxID=3403460 RepID=UPI003C734451